MTSLLKIDNKTLFFDTYYEQHFANNFDLNHFWVKYTVKVFHLLIHSSG